MILSRTVCIAQSAFYRFQKQYNLFFLFTEERQKLITEVDKEWKQICKKGDTDNELYENVNDCITKVIDLLIFY